MGDVILADVGLALRALVEEVGEANRAEPEPLPEPSAGDESDPMTPTMAHNTLAQVFPDDGIVVLESPSSTLALRNQLRLSKPGSYYFGAGGGLGFGLAAALGVQLAQPDRPVVCVLGEGSAQYAITGFWTAAAYDIPVTFFVLRNEEYSILKWFADVEEVKGAPGLDLPALEVARVAESYGVSSEIVTGRDELHASARGRDRLGEAPAGRGAGHPGHGALLGSQTGPRGRLLGSAHGAAGAGCDSDRARREPARDGPGARRARVRDAGAAAERADGAARGGPRPRRGSSTWSATPRTPARTGCCRRRS